MKFLANTIKFFLVTYILACLFIFFAFLLMWSPLLEGRPSYDGVIVAGALLVTAPVILTCAAAVILSALLIFIGQVVRYFRLNVLEREFSYLFSGVLPFVKSFLLIHKPMKDNGDTLMRFLWWIIIFICALITCVFGWIVLSVLFEKLIYHLNSSNLTHTSIHF